MANEPQTYSRLGDAEDALRTAGFTRDVQQALWVHSSLRERAKVVLQDFKFIIVKM